jgi:hypothetical protein
VRYDVRHTVQYVHSHPTLPHLRQSCTGTCAIHLVEWYCMLLCSYRPTHTVQYWTTPALSSGVRMDKVLDCRVLPTLGTIAGLYGQRHNLHRAPRSDRQGECGWKASEPLIQVWKLLLFTHLPASAFVPRFCSIQRSSFGRARRTVNPSRAGD